MYCTKLLLTYICVTHLVLISTLTIPQCAYHVRVASHFLKWPMIFPVCEMGKSSSQFTSGQNFDHFMKWVILQTACNIYTRGSQTVPFLGALLVLLVGGRIVCMRDIFILIEMWTEDKVRILVSPLLG
jgi:hypothetical protein